MFNMPFMFQVLQQTKLQIAINLLLAPIYALLSVLVPFGLLLFVVEQFLPNIPTNYAFLILVFIFGLVFYLLLIYPLLLICFLILHHIKRFNLLNIMITAVIANVLLGYLMDKSNLLGSILSFSIFTLPTAGFFIYRSWRQHQKVN